MNERDYRRRRCTAIGHSLRLSTPSLLEVRFCFELFSQFVFAKVFNRDSGRCFKDYSGFFFFSLFMATSTRTKCTPSSWSVKGAIKVSQSHLTGKGVRLSGVTFYFLRLKMFWPRLALRRTRETPLKTLVFLVNKSLS